MCGFAGWTGPPRPETLDHMIAPLASRGPDASGTWSDGDIHMGHRRLKVIDLEGGAQPMIGAGSVLVFNGEIYNFRELAGLLPADHAPAGDGDTAVLQALLEWRGRDILPELRGMFALAFWNRNDRSLLLVRDAVGQKPLFVAEAGDSLVFGSTTRALLAHPAVDGTLDPAALATVLAGESPREPATLHLGIRSLPPGSWLEQRDGRISRGTWWQWPETDFRASLDVEEFEHLFATAVSRRLVSDVPLGVFLSGGLDSSSVAMAAARAGGSSTLRTFSVGFEESSYDESPQARLMATALGSEHHEEILTEQALLDSVDEALASADQPLADSSLLPTWLLSRLARRHVTVALSGDGADDVMAGYDPFRALGPATWFNLLPGPVARMIGRWADSRPPADHNLPFPFRLGRFARGHGVTGGEAGRRWMSAWTDNGVAALLPDVPLEHWTRQHPDHGLDLIAWFRERYLRDQILVKVDRASMAHGLEVRNPLLDVDLLKAVSRLPFDQLFNGGRGKLPLRRWARTRLPREILERPKKGFGMPVSQWMRGPLADWIRDTVTRERLEELGLVPEPALALRDSHLAGTVDRRKELWTLAVLCRWRAQ